MKKTFALLAISAVALTACGGGTGSKQDYVDATVELMCSMDANTMTSGNGAGYEAAAMKVYKKYGFDVENEAAMNSIFEKYSNDEELATQIMKKGSSCLPNMGDMSNTK